MAERTCELCGEVWDRPKHGKAKRCPACRKCTVEWCEHLGINRGYCNGHYQHVIRGKEPGFVQGRDARPCGVCGQDWVPDRHDGTTTCPPCRICDVPGCNEPRRGRQFCGMHLARKFFQGVDPEKPVRRTCRWCDVSFELAPHSRMTRRTSVLCPDCIELAALGWKNRSKDNGARPPEIVRMLHEQGGRCAVCDATERLCVDHCHTSGKPRAILCANCNSALGLLAEDPGRLRAMADYIERHG